MHQRKRVFAILIVVLLAVLLSGCYSLEREQVALRATVSAMQDQMGGASMGGHDMGDMSSAPVSQAEVPDGPADVSYTLTTGTSGHNLVFIGVGGEIDGAINPTLVAEPGDIVEITLVNAEAVQHNLQIDEFGVDTGFLTSQGEEQTIKFLVESEGSFTYYCVVPGHQAAGMQGMLQVGSGDGASAATVVKHPADIPAPVGARGPQLVQAELVAQEVVGQLADGTTYPYFTFNGSVPGPFIRARVGDTVEITLRNETESAFVHSVDLHAATGPGGGGDVSQVQPGETKVFTFTALQPGIYVYHCATPSVPHHIASGMFGLILIEPEGGLPPVDREFYVMQSEIYTMEPFGTPGELTFSHEKMANEQPEYFVFNGAVGAMGLASEDFMLNANVGETVRIFMGVGGPNFTSSFHVIGEIFDRAYAFGSLSAPPLTDVQTISVPPGGAVMVEFRVDYPGHYVLVDHALSRLERGLVGMLHVEGTANPNIFKEGPANP